MFVYLTELKTAMYNAGGIDILTKTEGKDRRNKNSWG